MRKPHLFYFIKMQRKIIKIVFKRVRYYDFSNEIFVEKSQDNYQKELLVN